MYIIAYNVVGLSLYLPCFRVYFVVVLYVVFYTHIERVYLGVLLYISHSAHHLLPPTIFYILYNIIEVYFLHSAIFFTT